MPRGARRFAGPDPDRRSELRHRLHHERRLRHGEPAFDADNYECSGGVCRYLGCNADGECAATFSDARYVCR